MVIFHLEHTSKEGEEVKVGLVGGEEEFIVELLVGEVVSNGRDQIFIGGHTKF